MIRQTIEQIEARLRAAGALPDPSRDELLRLLASLKAEVAELHGVDADQARSIAGFTELSAHEATREDKKPELLQASLGGLAASVNGFEASHPRLVLVVNALCQTLSDLGI